VAIVVRLRPPLLPLLLCLVHCSPAAPRPAPNVVLFLADDQGWSGTSVAMDDQVPGSRSDYYRTPALEGFARQGMRFAQAYASSPVCSPTRASIQTGKSPALLHLTDVILGERGRAIRADYVRTQRLEEPASRVELPQGETTIAEAIRSARPEYATAHFGKWHLGGGGPARHGYLEQDAALVEAGPGVADLPEGVRGVVPRAVRFVRAQASAGRPFFLQVSHFAVHKGFPVRDEDLRAARRRPLGRLHRNPRLAAMTEELDSDFGALLAALDATGLSDRTYVLYLSDNGAYTDRSSNAPLSGGKFSLREGGLRVPLVVRGPGIAPGRVARVPVVTVDLLPTILDLLGIAERPPGIEGGSFAPVLRGGGRGGVQRPRHELVWYFPHYYFFLGRSTPQAALRLGRYKLLVDYDADTAQVFDLRTDLAEEHDLSAQRPRLARNLRARLDRYLAAVGEPTPAPRRDAAPTAPAP
jgi:arylsulfatase A